jgi:Protein of unknown function (DUF3800)
VRSLFAYTDESGNTGQNLFDEAQPYFLTGTLLTNADVDLTGQRVHQNWLSSLGITELHGHAIGIGKIDKISATLKQFLQAHASRFVFTQIEKRFHAAARLSFTILDSDFNQAVSPMHDLTSIFHRKMALDIFSFLTHGEAKAFWSAYESLNFSQFVQILDNLRLRIFERHTDNRGRQLLLDALNWAAANPREIFRSTRTDGDSPNVLALRLLLGGIHKTTGEQSRIVKFCHDEQNQFGEEIAASFDLAKNVRGFADESTFLFRMERINKFLCPIKMTVSEQSIGLQITDVILDLMSQYLENSYQPRLDDCGALCEYVTQNSTLEVFTYDGLKDLFISQYSELMNREFTPEQIKRA